MVQEHATIQQVQGKLRNLKMVLVEAKEKKDTRGNVKFPTTVNGTQVTETLVRLRKTLGVAAERAHRERSGQVNNGACQAANNGVATPTQSVIEGDVGPLQEAVQYFAMADQEQKNALNRLQNSLHSLSRAQQQRSLSNSNSRDLGAQSQVLEEQLREARAESQRMQVFVQEHMQRAQELDGEVRRLRQRAGDEDVSLKSELHRSKQNEQMMSEEVQELQRAIQSMKRCEQDHVRAAEGLSAQIRELEARPSGGGHGPELTAALTRASQAEEAHHHLHAQLQSAQVRMRELEVGAQSKHDEVQARALEYERRSTESSHLVDQKNVELQQLRAQITDFEARIADMQAAGDLRGHSQQRADELQIAADNLVKRQAEMDRIGYSLERRQAELGEREGTFHKKELMAKAELENAARALQERENELVNRERRVQDYEAKQHSMGSQNTKYLEAELEQARSQIAEYKQANTEIVMLKERLSAADFRAEQEAEKGRALEQELLSVARSPPAGASQGPVARERRSSGLSGAPASSIRSNLSGMTQSVLQRGSTAGTRPTSTTAGARTTTSTSTRLGARAVPSSMSATSAGAVTGIAPPSRTSGVSSRTATNLSGRPGVPPSSRPSMRTVPK